MKRNSRSCGVLVFMFYGEIDLLCGKRRQRDGNGKYHMRTIIVPLLALYIIIAISPSSRPLVSLFISLSLMRLVHRLVSHLILAHCSHRIGFLRAIALSHIDTITP